MYCVHNSVVCTVEVFHQGFCPENIVKLLSSDNGPNSSGNSSDLLSLGHFYGWYYPHPCGFPQNTIIAPCALILSAILCKTFHRITPCVSCDSKGLGKCPEYKVHLGSNVQRSVRDIMQWLHQIFGNPIAHKFYSFMQSANDEYYEYYICMHDYPHRKGCWAGRLDTTTLGIKENHMKGSLVGYWLYCPF